ncbi:hypothetical protein FVE85_8631 [Porphyridium purpureum]|uniref:Uncharacterized protein n=1 Tax=Porphyridium purpureum TaxID=35688 RepID=A0A5J4YPD2_PORPP|nr:hypothetical protein FVE85_8631 [Porphyridium purpureum]|eukprot:POR3211..scf296_7
MRMRLEMAFVAAVPRNVDVDAACSWMRVTPLRQQRQTLRVASALRIHGRVASAPSARVLRSRVEAEKKSAAGAGKEVNQKKGVNAKAPEEVKFALNIKGKPVWDLRRARLEDVDALMSILPSPYGSSRSLVVSLVKNALVMVADFSIMTKIKVEKRVLGAGLAVCKGGARSSGDATIVQRAEMCAFVIADELTASSYRADALKTLLLGVAAQAQEAGAVELGINPHGMVLGVDAALLQAIGCKRQNDSLYVLSLESKKIEPGKKII